MGTSTYAKKKARDCAFFGFATCIQKKEVHATYSQKVHATHAFFFHATYTKYKVHATYAKERLYDLRFFPHSTHAFHLDTGSPSPLVEV